MMAYYCGIIIDLGVLLFVDYVGYPFQLYCIPVNIRQIINCLNL